MKNPNVKSPHRYSKSFLKLYFDNQNNVTTFAFEIINRIFVHYLNKTNTETILQSNDINALLLIEKKNINLNNTYNNDNYIEVKVENANYMNMIYDTIDKNIRGEIYMKKYTNISYEEMFNEYKIYYEEIANSNKLNKTKAIIMSNSNQNSTTFNNRQNELNSFDNCKRPENSKEVYNYSNFSTTINAAKLNDSVNEMNTLSTSSNTITHPNKIMKIMKIGLKDEFTFSGLKEKNNNVTQTNQMDQRISPNHHHDGPQKNNKFNSKTTTTNHEDYLTTKSLINHQNNIGVIEVKKNLIDPSRIPKFNQSIIKINKSSSNKIDNKQRNKKSLSPRQKYSLQIPIPKHKKSSISPTNKNHYSIYSIIPSSISPFESYIPIKTNSNVSSLETANSSYVSIMKKKKLIKDCLSVDLTKNNSIKQNNNGKRLNEIPSDRKQKDAQKDEEKFNQEEKRTKSKIKFELDLSDDDADKGDFYQCLKPFNPLFLEQKGNRPNQKSQKPSQQLISVIETNTINQITPNCNIMVYKTFDKLQKLKELKNKQKKFKHISSFSIKNVTKIVSHNHLHCRNLECIKEENKSRSHSLSQDNQSDKSSFEKAKRSTLIFENNLDEYNNKNKEKYKRNKTNENEIESYLPLNSLKLQFKINSDINMNTFSDIIFL